MKIGLIVPGFSSDERDWCIPAHLDLARSLALDHQVHVFTLRYPHRRDDYSVYSTIVHSRNGYKRQALASVVLWADTLEAIRREHHRSRFDVLHAIYGGEAGFVAVLASRFLHVPCFVSLLGGEMIGLKDIGYGQDLLWRQRLMNRFAIRHADRIFCGSRQMADLARSRVGDSAGERVQRLPLGVDTSMFSSGVKSRTQKGDGSRIEPHSAAAAQQPTPEGRFEILNVGSLIPVKDHATLLRAFAQVATELPDAHLKLVGTGILEGNLHALASDLEIDDRIDWAGAVDHDKLPEVYRSATLYVQSSRHEGQGMAVLEAASSGLPLAGTDVGVLSDLAARGAGIAVPPGDAASLARAMLRAIDSSEELGRRASNIVRLEYNLDRIRGLLLTSYRTRLEYKDARYLSQPVRRP